MTEYLTFLYSLVDYARHNPASTFPAMPADWFWSSSSHAYDADRALGVNFGDGYVGSGVRSSVLAVRCVRQ